MAVDALYKDRDSRVQVLEAELRRKSDACAEERLREALADGLARVTFMLINSSLSELTCFYFCY